MDNVCLRGQCVLAWTMYACVDNVSVLHFLHDPNLIQQLHTRIHLKHLLLLNPFNSQQPSILNNARENLNNSRFEYYEIDE